MASDVDALGMIQYSVAGDTIFIANPINGSIMLLNGESLDYESQM